MSAAVKLAAGGVLAVALYLYATRTGQGRELVALARRKYAVWTGDACCEACADHATHDAAAAPAVDAGEPGAEEFYGVVLGDQQFGVSFGGGPAPTPSTGAPDCVTGCGGGGLDLPAADVPTGYEPSARTPSGTVDDGRGLPIGFVDPAPTTSTSKLGDVGTLSTIRAVY